jgi:hypothetical protein
MILIKKMFHQLLGHFPDFYSGYFFLISHLITVFGYLIFYLFTVFNFFTITVVVFMFIYLNFFVTYMLLHFLNIRSAFFPIR